MAIQSINLNQKLSILKEHWSPRIIAQMNDYHFKLVRMKREFIWHQHPETDEVFMVIDGRLRIDLRDQVLHLGKGEMVVIPKGVEHKPSCREECRLLLIEPAGTVNAGDAGGDLTDKTTEWI